MTERGDDLVSGAQILVDGLGFGRRFDDDDVHEPPGDWLISECPRGRALVAAWLLATLQSHLSLTERNMGGWGAAVKPPSVGKAVDIVCSDCTRSALRLVSAPLRRLILVYVGRVAWNLPGETSAASGTFRARGRGRAPP